MEIARRLATRLAGGDRRRPGPYEYGNRPLREEVLREFRNAAGGLDAVVTRNAYGCLVLNTAQLMFVDVDLGEPPRRGGVLGWLLGDGQAGAKRDTARQSLLDRAEEWTRRHPGWGWRIYETRAGWRLAATHRAISPEEPVCAEVFAALGADPLYQRLCGHQKCFRARLTPKPWRCQMPNPPGRWPFLDERAAQAHRRWESRYQSACAGFATCRLVARFGPPQPASRLAELLDFHDLSTLCGEELSLA